MSTILRALKKLEKDAAVDADAHRLPGKMIAGPRRTRSRLMIYMTILASVALVAGIAAFAKFYPAGLNTDAPQKLKYAAKAPAHAENKGEKTLPNKSINEKPGDMAANRLPPVEKGKAAAKASGIFESAAPITTSSSVPAAKSKNDGGTVTGRSGASTRQADADQEGKGNGADRKTSLPTASNPVADASNEPVIHEDIGLQIQAISWNQTPSRRIAVINSRLCREGEQISGYRILAINPDDIVVSNGQKTGKLMFNMH